MKRKTKKIVSLGLAGTMLLSSAFVPANESFWPFGYNEVKAEETGVGTDNATEDNTIVTNDENGIPSVRLYEHLCNVCDYNGDGAISVGELASETSLSYNEYGEEIDVTNLSKYMPNLTYISITRTEVGDYVDEDTEMGYLSNEAIAELSKTNVCSLIIDNCYFEDITQLSIITNLDVLAVHRASPEDIAKINKDDFLNLTTLSIYDTDLSGISLDNIKAMSNLSTLNLSDVNIEDVTFINDTNFPNLTSLKVSGSKLSDASIEGIATLENLSYLEIAYAELEDIEFINSTNFPNLCTLYLWGNNIPNVPESITTLTNLTSLNISDCNIRLLPDMTGMTNLTELSIYSMYLSDDELVSNIPESFATSAEWISANCNPDYDPNYDDYYEAGRVIITNDENGIPDDALYALMLEQGDYYNGNGDGILNIAEASRIYSLVNHYYYINDVYTDIKDYTNVSKYAINLQQLAVNMNQMTEENVSVFVEELAKLDKLDWINMSISSIASEQAEAVIEVLADNDKLGYIWMNAYNSYDENGNLIDEPIDISKLGKLDNLYTIEIYGERFENVEAAINNFSNLHNLYVSGEAFDLAKIDNAIRTQLNLLYMNISIENFTVDVSACINLIYLSVYTHNPKITGIEKLQQLQTLYLNDWYSNGEDDVETDVSFLKQLPTSLNDIEISYIPVESIKNDTNITELTNLYSLRIAYAGLKDIEGLSKLTNISWLELYGNEISELSELSKLTNLNHLDASNNNISNANGIAGLRELRWLNLSHNQLEIIPDISGMDSLCYDRDSENKVVNNLQLYGNKLTEDDVKDKVPEEFSSDRLWILSTILQSVNGTTFYANNISSKDIALLLNDGQNWIDISTEVSAEFISELYEILKDEKSYYYVHFVDPETGNYVGDIYIYGEQLTSDDITKSSNFTYREIVEVTSDVKKKYTDAYGDAVVAMEGYTFAGKWDTSASTEMYVWPEFTKDEEYYFEFENKVVDLYYYDYATKQSHMIQKSINTYGPFNINVAANDEARKYLGKSADEGYYYVVDSMYRLEGDAPVGEVDDGTSISGPFWTDWTKSYLIKNKLNISLHVQGGIENWNNLVTVFTNKELSGKVPPEYEGGDDYKEYAVIRMDKWGWGELGENARPNYGLNGEPIEYSWDLTDINGNGDVFDDFVRIMKNAKVDVSVKKMGKKMEVKYVVTALDEDATFTYNVNFTLDKANEDMYAFFVCDYSSVRILAEGEVVETGKTEVGGSVPETVKPSQIVSSEKAVSTITDALNDTQSIKPVVSTIVDKPITLKADMFESMKKNNKDLVVEVVDDVNQIQYSWSFDYQSIDLDKVGDIDLSIKFDTEKKAEIEELTGQKEALYLEFAHHGDLPAPAKIKTYVGNQYADGEIIYLYYFNEELGKVESITGAKGLEVINGYVEYTITHCSIYFLSMNTPDVYGLDVEEPEEPTTEEPTTEKPEEAPKTGDVSNTSTVMVMLLVSCMAVALLNVLGRKDNKENV